MGEGDHMHISGKRGSIHTFLFTLILLEKAGFPWVTSAMREEMIDTDVLRIIFFIPMKK